MVAMLVAADTDIGSNRITLIANIGDARNSLLFKSVED